MVSYCVSTLLVSPMSARVVLSSQVSLFSIETYSEPSHWERIHRLSEFSFLISFHLWKNIFVCKKTERYWRASKLKEVLSNVNEIMKRQNANILSTASVNFAGHYTINRDEFLFRRIVLIQIVQSIPRDPIIHISLMLYVTFSRLVDCYFCLGSMSPF